MRKASILFTLIISFSIPANAQTASEDTVSTQRKNLFKRIYEYFEKSNDVDPDKRFDFSIIGGPHYSSDTKLGLGLIASGLYRVDMDDKEMSPSNVSLYGDITTSGAYVIGISNNTLFSGNRYRMDADLFFAYTPSRYWGVGYTAGRKKHYSEYDDVAVELKFDFLKKIISNAYLGVTVNVKDIKGKKFEEIELLGGENPHNTAVGAGLILSYDSRDFIPNPYKGIYAKAEFIYYPKFLGSNLQFNRTELIFRCYNRVWEGGHLAFDAQGIFNHGDVAWSMLAQTGSSNQMRGYYMGRYRDKNLIQTQLELRQKIYKRNGAAIWMGAGNVFSKFSSFEWNHTLPTYGLGYRWEFKSRVNIRIDYGFGKGGSSFYFNINEAF